MTRPRQLRPRGAAGLRPRRDVRAGQRPAARRRRCCCSTASPRSTATAARTARATSRPSSTSIRDLWFFDCHFIGDPVMPGCLGLDACGSWSASTSAGSAARAAAARWACGEVKFTGQVTPARQEGHLQDRHEAGDQLRRLVMGIGDGVLEADGKPIYEAEGPAGRPVQRRRPGLSAKRETDQHAPRRRHRDGHRLLDRQQRQRGAGVAARGAGPGVVAAPEYAELGFRCQVHAAPQIDWEAHGRPPRRALPGRRHGLRPHRHGTGDRRLPAWTEAEVSNERTGLIVGSGGPSTRAIVEAAEISQDQGRQAHRPVRGAQGDELRPLGDARRPGSRSSGLNFSISSACATSTHCIGVGYEQIELGKQDIVFAGGCEELDWTLIVPVRRHGRHVARKFNDRPAVASRAYDVDRDGFVIAGGGRDRGAGGAGARQGPRREDLRRDRRLRGQFRRLRHGRALRRGRGALHAPGAWTAPAGARSTISTRTAPPRRSATSRRWRRCARCSATTLPLISSTKSLTGHSLGAAGAQEAIYCLLMMQQRLRRRERQHRDTSTRPSPTCRSSASGSTGRWRR